MGLKAIQHRHGSFLPSSSWSGQSRTNAGEPIYWLGMGIALLCLANLTNLLLEQPFWPVTRFINMGLEANLPTWYTSMMWAVGAVLALRCRLDSTLPRARLTWLLLALVFALFSMDEVAQVHENLGRFVVTHYMGAYGGLYKTARWVLLFAPLVIVGGAILARYIRPVLKEVPESLFLMMAGLGVFLLAALGIESTTNLLNHDTLQWAWDLEIVLEESLEMVGVWLVLKACAIYHITLSGETAL